MLTLPRPVPAFYHSVFLDIAYYLPRFKNCLKHSAAYLRKRYAREGMTIVSRSLPVLGKAIETCVITGQKLILPPGFTTHYMSSLPAFLYDLIHTFISDNGLPCWVTSSEEEDAAFCFYAVRQITMAFSKAIDLGSQQTKEEALSAFSSRIQELTCITAPSWLLNRARALLKQLLMEDGHLHPMLAQWDSIPFGRHGPGAVAEREKSLSKWRFKRIPGISHELYQFRLSSDYQFGNELDNLITPVMGEGKPYSRVCVVPKDFKSLRTICIEPKEFQFAQQGLWDVLRSLIHAHPLTRKAINFNHQEYNGRLCKRGDIATIDLKDASDRVSLKLCRYLLPKEVFRLVTRYRSRKILMNGNLLTPTCFASMGSALCFPIETLVFWAIARSAMHPLDRRLPLRVFGDDIVVPKGSASFIVKMLEACGFKVNEGKTCIHTPVRESCGAYFYHRTDVRITRFKYTECASLPAWFSFCEEGRHLYERKLFQTSVAMLLCAKDWWHVPFGYLGYPPSNLKSELKEISPSSLVCQDDYRCQSRWNRKLQRSELRFPGIQMVTGKGQIPLFAGLYAWLVGNSTKPDSHGTQKVKVSWVDNPI